MGRLRAFSIAYSLGLLVTFTYLMLHGEMLHGEVADDGWGWLIMIPTNLYLAVFWPAYWILSLVMA